MNKETNSGPKTKAGKKISSRNATTHGLTAKHWSNPVEQESYSAFLSALIKDYQPETVMEHTLIEKLADTKTRLDRFHNAEDALFALAHERANAPDYALNSFEIDDKEVLEELSDHAFGINQQKDLINEKLFKELINQDLSDVSGWKYIKENMPFLREHILGECKKENEDMEEFMSRYKLPSNRRSPTKWYIHAVDPAEPIEEKTLVESGLQVPKESFIAYIKALLAQTKRRNMISALIEDFDNRTKLLKRSALPDGPSLDRLMRYRTTLERQFSKTLGELLHIINLRKR